MNLLRPVSEREDGGGDSLLGVVMVQLLQEGLATQIALMRSLVTIQVQSFREEMSTPRTE